MFERLARRYMIDKRTGFNKIELLFVPPFFFFFFLRSSHTLLQYDQAQDIYKVDWPMDDCQPKKERGRLAICQARDFFLLATIFSTPFPKKIFWWQSRGFFAVIGCLWVVEASFSITKTMFEIWYDYKVFLYYWLLIFFSPQTVFMAQSWILCFYVTKSKGGFTLLF